MLNKVFGAVGNFCYRFRAAISIIGVLLFAAVCFMQSKATISYTNPKSFKVTDVFPIDDTLVLVYDNEDEDQIHSLIDYLSENEHVTSLRCYANTLGMQMTSSEIAGIAGMTEMFAAVYERKRRRRRRPYTCSVYKFHQLRRTPERSGCFPNDGQ